MHFKIFCDINLCMRCVSTPKERMTNKNFILSGRYKLIRPLGKGQCGSVYLARQQSLEQYRAIKIFPKTTAQPLFAISEAQILKSVQHPGIPTIYDLEEDESFYYLVEEYVQGDSLEEFLLHHQSISQNLFLKFCEQLCDIFAYLHTLRPAPILYQDLKPEHIIVCGMQIKLIDFSVASFAASNGNDFKNFGNLDFSAPELSSAGPVSLSSDIYSIGKIMEYMMTFLDAASARTIQPIIQKSILAEPEQRYTSSQELYSALETTFDNTGGTHLRQTIAVIGDHSGCGSTHIAVSLVTTLNAMGITTVYQEKNWSNALRKAAEQMDHIWEKNGCYYYHSFVGYPKYDIGVELPAPTAEIIVDDYGCDYSPPDLATADVILYVCGGAVWHRSDANPKDYLIQNFGSRLRITANLCDRNAAIYFARQFSQPVYPYPYDTDIFRNSRGKEDFVHWLIPEKGREHLFLRLKNHLYRLLQP